VHAPWVLSDSGSPDEAAKWLDGAVEAFGGRVARHGAHEFTGAPLTFGVGEHTLTATADGERIAVRGGHGEALIDAEWTSLRLDSTSGVWLRSVDVRGRRLLLHTGAWVSRSAGHNPGLVEALRQAPVFAGEGLGSCYRTGLFGPRLVDGGDGGAEDVFLSSVGVVHRVFETTVESVLAGHRADLVVLYLPTTDDVGHELIGWCDSASAAYRPDVAAEVWRRVARCYRWADALLGRVLERAGEEDTVVLGADHGMAGTAWTLHPNQVLVDAGLAATTAEGDLDPRRSAVVYHPVNNGSLWVNDDYREGGWVPRHAAAGLLRKAAAALRRTGTPTGHRTLVTSLVPAPEGGSAHLLLDPDCLPSAELRPDGRAVVPARKPGAHVTNGGDERLHAVFAAAGPGLPRGQDLGVLDNTRAAALVLDQLNRASSHPTAKTVSQECIPT
jgi:Type I phosphodiesterase / nucleotide pyrophosphatase